MEVLDQDHITKLIKQLEEAQAEHAYWKMAYVIMEEKFNLRLKELENLVNNITIAPPFPDHQYRIQDLENKNRRLKTAVIEITEAIVEYVNQEHPEIISHPKYYELRNQLNTLYLF